MFYEQLQQDTHILTILGDQKHCFKVRSNALSYTRAFRSVFNRGPHLLSGSVTSHDITPPSEINSKQVELIFLGTCPTATPALQQKYRERFQAREYRRVLASDPILLDIQW